jgi:hypothetical protein
MHSLVIGPPAAFLKILMKKICYAVNRIAGLAVMIGYGIYAVVAALIPYNPAADDNFATWAIHLAAFVIPLVIGLGLAARYARRL